MTYTYSGSVMIARLDGADVQEIMVGNTVMCVDIDDVEASCHIETIDSVKIAFPGYKIISLPTLSNGKLSVKKASDSGF